jgi:DNA-directed RNA polymerase subunit RPC12/RpoP
MSVISEVKCGRCDRKYSGFRSRCPYCGARRSKRGKHADEAENSRAKLLIGIVLLVVLIGATMVLIFTSLPKPGEQDPDAAASDASSVPSLPDSEAGISSLETPDVSESPSPSLSPSPVIEISAIIITWGAGYDRDDVTIDKIGGTEQFSFRTVPEMDTEDLEATWESTNEEIFMVVNGKVTAISEGWATLKCTVDGVTGTCIIRVNPS